MQQLPHQHRLRKGRYSQPNQIYHVITNTKNRQPIFKNYQSARKLVQQLIIQQQLENAITLAFVVMPDHLHWLLQINQKQTLSTIVKSVKAKTAQAIGQPVWQSGYYDHAIRRDEDIVNIARYIIVNPIRAGLVKKVGDYPHWDAVWL
jgi:REP element-mobilizing transposase RayT